MVKAEERVKAAEDLVQDHHVWLADEGGRELDLLLHPLAQGVHLAVAPFGQAHALEPVVGASAGFGAGHPLREILEFVGIAPDRDV